MSLQLLRATHAVLGRVAPGAAASLARERFLTPRRAPERPWEPAVEARGERLGLEDGTSLLRFGATGPRVLAVHGWEGRATQLGPLAEALVPAGFQVLALDAPAHGRSPGDKAHPVAFARALLAADRAHGPFHAVLGHSMGGGAAALALGWGLRAERAVLIGAPASVEAVLERFGRYVGLPSAAQARFVAAIEEHVGVPVEEVQVDALAERLSVPALIVHDRGDLEVPFADGASIARRWPGATLLATEGLGHRRVLRDPEVLAAVRCFLAGESLAAA